MLRLPCILGNPQHRGTKSKEAAPPLPSHVPKRGRKCYSLRVFSCILGNPQHRGTKSEVATSPVPAQGTKRGRKCDVSAAFSGSPNIGEQNHNCLPHPCLLAGPKKGRNAMSPLHSQGSPTPRQGVKSEVVLWSSTKGNKIKRGLLTRAFMGAQKRAEMLRLPCILGNPQHRGTKSEVATSPLPSCGPKRGWKCYGYLAFSGIPNIGEQTRKRLPHPCLLGGPKEGGNAMSLEHSQGSPT